MDVHTDIDIGDDETPRHTFEFIPSRKTVYAAHDYIALTEVFGALLPFH